MGNPLVANASSRPSGPDLISEELSPDALATLASPVSQDIGAVRAAVIRAASPEDVATAALSDERMVAGTKVNGQQLFERDGHRFYYPDGDTKSNLVSVQQPDGSFKWTTKEAMLAPNGNNFRGNQPHQISSIETTNGKFAAMYAFPDGSKAYFDGKDWHQKKMGEDTFKTVAGSRISFRGTGGNEVMYAAPGSAVVSR